MGGGYFGAYMCLKKLPRLRRASFLDQTNRKPYKMQGYVNLGNGGRYWTRTSDPYRVKVVL